MNIFYKIIFSIALVLGTCDAIIAKHCGAKAQVAVCAAKAVKRQQKARLAKQFVNEMISLFSYAKSINKNLLIYGLDDEMIEFINMPQYQRNLIKHLTLAELKTVLSAFREEKAKLMSIKQEKQFFAAFDKLSRKLERDPRFKAMRKLPLMND